MATIPLTDGHQLKSDKKQWILQKSGIDKEGAEYWTSIGYYSALGAAVNASYSYFLRRSDADSIGALLADGRAILSELTAALEPSFILTEA